ncbi:uncharacterized protein MICPUCDRAFT_56363 [Micromonas pusilla CCMP1545]|uniref:Predicted protein n=1 Tax=Micromonas pusilla (strain CCMP1545) TaxID=564608 RepID=C1MM15_MICPC|nr:uncharacterized protein MICPUCDRAFT_56363 [Micromonas pusilla CCMP1545]EEH58961.1 predicted protein [Micromonas pusilla CCMP1545]|eukprot:XP_003057316.1 predicted protein [Micromonas pusilla CCMP1545]
MTPAESERPSTDASEVERELRAFTAYEAVARSIDATSSVRDLLTVSTSSALLVTLLKHYAARCLAPDALARADEFDPGDKEHGSFLWTTLGALTNLLNGPEFDFDDGARAIARSPIPPRSILPAGSRAKEADSVDPRGPVPKPPSPVPAESAAVAHLVHPHPRTLLTPTDPADGRVHGHAHEPALACAQITLQNGFYRGVLAPLLRRALTQSDPCDGVLDALFSLLNALLFQSCAASSVLVRSHQTASTNLTRSTAAECVACGVVDALLDAAAREKNLHAAPRVALHALRTLAGYAGGHVVDASDPAVEDEDEGDEGDEDVADVADVDATTCDRVRTGATASTRARARGAARDEDDFGGGDNARALAEKGAFGVLERLIGRFAASGARGWTPPAASGGRAATIAEDEDALDAFASPRKRSRRGGGGGDAATATAAAAAAATGEYSANARDVAREDASGACGAAGADASDGERVVNAEASYRHPGEELLSAALKLLKRMLKRVAARTMVRCASKATLVALVDSVSVIALNVKVAPEPRSQARACYLEFTEEHQRKAIKVLDHLGSILKNFTEDEGGTFYPAVRLKINEAILTGIDSYLDITLISEMDGKVRGSQQRLYDHDHAEMRYFRREQYDERLTADVVGRWLRLAAKHALSLTKPVDENGEKSWERREVDPRMKTHNIYAVRAWRSYGQLGRLKGNPLRDCEDDRSRLWMEETISSWSETDPDDRYVKCVDEAMHRLTRLAIHRGVQRCAVEHWRVMCCQAAADLLDAFDAGAFDGGHAPLCGGFSSYAVTVFRGSNGIESARDSVMDVLKELAARVFERPTEPVVSCGGNGRLSAVHLVNVMTRTYGKEFYRPFYHDTSESQSEKPTRLGELVAPESIAWVADVLDLVDDAARVNARASSPSRKTRRAPAWLARARGDAAATRRLAESASLALAALAAFITRLPAGPARRSADERDDDLSRLRRANLARAFATAERMKLCPRESENACFAEESVPPFPPSPTIDLFRRAREAIEDAHARATAAKTAEGRVVAVATPAAAMREKAPAASAGAGRAVADVVTPAPAASRTTRRRTRS